MIGALLCVVSAGCGSREARVRRELETRYAENSAAFKAKDTTAIYALRAPGYHTETPDGLTHSSDDMRAYTRRLFEMIAQFDSIGFRIDSLGFRGDTAVVVAYQYTTRSQHLPGTPDSELHHVTASVVQREQWVPSDRGWLLWRVDEIRDQKRWVDGALQPPRQ
jgi:hypothetical protein